MQTYYNTTSLTGSDLKQAIYQASKQDEAIKMLYDLGKSYSPSQIREYCLRAGRDWPLTSCRRSITNLTKQGVLRMTGEQVMGSYGRLENKWIKI